MSYVWVLGWCFRVLIHILLSADFDVDYFTSGVKAPVGLTSIQTAKEVSSWLRWIWFIWSPIDTNCFLHLAGAIGVNKPFWRLHATTLRINPLVSDISSLHIVIDNKLCSSTSSWLCSWWRVDILYYIASIVFRFPDILHKWFVLAALLGRLSHLAKHVSP